MAKNTIVSLFILSVLLGCDREALMKKFIPKDEVEFSKQFVALFRSRSFDAIEEKMNPKLRDALRQKLEQIAAAFPDEDPKDVKVVGSITGSSNDVWRGNFTLQYEFPSKWLLVNITLRKSDGALTVDGFYVQPMRDSLENINRFTFRGKGAGHYLILAWVILEPMFIVFALVLCIKTPIPKRKWLWAIFILLGFTKVTLNWTTGAVNTHLVCLQLLGISLAQGGLYGPVVMSVSVPLGAIIFMVMRKKWLGQPAPATGPKNANS